MGRVVETGGADAQGAFELGHHRSLLAGQGRRGFGIEEQNRQTVGRTVGTRAADTYRAFGLRQRRGLLAGWDPRGVGIVGQNRQAVGRAVGTGAADAPGLCKYSGALLHQRWKLPPHG